MTMTAPTDEQQLDDAVQLAVELIGRVRAGDSPGVERLLHDLGAPRLHNLAVALAHLADDHATMPELRDRLGAGDTLTAHLAMARCAPELWGASINSRAVHGTRSRYNAGCRGALCVEAERAYQRSRPPRNRPAPAARARRRQDG